MAEGKSKNASSTVGISTADIKKNKAVGKPDMASSSRPSFSNEMSHADFKLMMRDLASEAEQRLPGPPPNVQRLHKKQKKNRRKMATILVISLGLLVIMFYCGIKYADDLPLGLGGILKAYTVGSKAPVPEPGQTLKPSQQPRPMDPSQWGKR